MALEYSLELEGAVIDWTLVLAALNAVNARDIEMSDVRPRNGFFSRSGTYFRIIDSGRLKEVSAEGFPKDEFLTRYSIVFRLDANSLGECVLDICDFLRAMASMTPYKFVLSYQFEDVCAFRTDRFVWDWNG